MFTFFRFGGLHLSHAFDMGGEGDWMTGFLKALHARFMARIAEWKEAHSEFLPPQPNDPQGDGGQGTAFKSAGEGGDLNSPLLVVPRTDTSQPTDENVPPLEGLELIFESPASGSSDLSSVFARLSPQVELDGPIMQLVFIRPPVDILVPDFPG